MRIFKKSKIFWTELQLIDLVKFLFYGITWIIGTFKQRSSSSACNFTCPVMLTKASFLLELTKLLHSHFFRSLLWNFLLVLSALWSFLKLLAQIFTLWSCFFFSCMIKLHSESVQADWRLTFNQRKLIHIKAFLNTRISKHAEYHLEHNKSFYVQNFFDEGIQAFWMLIECKIFLHVNWHNNIQ